MLRSLLIENFKGFPQSYHVDFQDGITLIVGKNGSGKSSLLYGLKFALFGVDKREGVLTPNFNRKSAAVAELDFDGKNGTRYQVSYTYKPYGRGNQGELFKYDDNGSLELCELSELPSVFPFPIDLFNDVFFIEEGDLYRFLETKKRAWERLRQHLSALLQLDKLDRMMASLSKVKKAYADKRKSLKTRYEELHERDLTRELGQLLDELRVLEEEQNSFTEINISSIESWVKLKTKLESLKEEFQRTSDRVKTLRARFNVMNSSEFDELIKQAKVVVEKTRALVDEQNQKLEEIKRKEALYHGVVELLRAVIKDDDVSHCPTCRQPLTIDTAKASLELAMTDLKGQQRKAETLNEAVKKSKDELQKAEHKLKELIDGKNEFAALLTHLKEVKQELEMLEQEEKRAGDLSSFEDMIRRRDSLEKRREELNREVREIRELLTEYDSLPARLHELEARETFSSRLLDAVKLTRNSRLKRHLDPVEQQLRDLIRLIKGENWDVVFQDSIEPVFRRHGEGDTEIRLEDLSGGEKTLVFLVFRWLLSEQLAGKPFLIMDDALNHLDSENKKVFFSLLIQLLEKREKKDYQLILASFDDSLEEYLKPLNPFVQRLG